MRFLDLTLPTPEENLALDEVLLRAAEVQGGGEVLRLWESARCCVVLGKNCSLARDVCTEACQADGVPVLRRLSGGGTVLLGPGCLNYSIVLRCDRAAGLDSVPESFAYILGYMQTAIESCGSACQPTGTDLVVGDRKIGGSAQRRQHSHLLHHGTIMYDFDLSRIARYLQEPPRQPPHRRGRDHLSFLTNLSVPPLDLRRAIRQCWQAHADLGQRFDADVTSLVRQRYGDLAWTQRLR